MAYRKFSRPFRRRSYNNPVKSVINMVSKPLGFVIKDYTVRIFLTGVGTASILEGLFPEAFDLVQRPFSWAWNKVKGNESTEFSDSDIDEFEEVD